MLKHFLPPELAMLPEPLLIAVSNVAIDTLVTHQALAQPAHAKARASPHQGSNGPGQYAGAVSCLCCAGYLGCGLGIQAGVVGCLAGAFALGSQLRRTARERIAPLLNSWNASAWSSATSSSPSEAGPGGIVVELPEQHLELLEPLARDYLLEQLFPGRCCRCAVEWLEPGLRRWIAGAFQDEAAVPLLVERRMKEHVVPIMENAEEFLWIPRVPVLLQLDLNPLGTGAGCGTLVRRARVAISDQELKSLIDAVTEQVVRWDLRELDPRLAGFTQPVRVDFKFHLHWPCAGKLEAAVSDFKLDLHLPS